MDIRTRCIHGETRHADCTGSIPVPIYQSATFAHPGAGMSTGYDYSRLQNPTREQLETIMASLEHGVDAIAFSTGMAAITAVLALFKNGDHLVSSIDLYGGTSRLFNHLSNSCGLAFDLVDATDPGQIEAAIRPETKAIFIETPSNPMMHVVDLKAVSRLARAHSLLLIVDNTFLTPYFLNPIDLGADIVIHSGTKYLGGHNDTLAGFAIVATEALSASLRLIFKTTGACLAPMDSWLLIRGIKTLAVRLEKQQENALAIAVWLKKHPRIRNVHYIGLPDHPQHAVSKAQSRGFGAMISFEVESADLARLMLDRVNLILYAESLGGVESLITYPIVQTHADVPEDRRASLGISDRLLRLSVGLEHVDDLIADLEQALLPDEQL